jgi:protocatechuate 3,4-dioxygenase beta subunit
MHTSRKDHGFKGFGFKNAVTRSAGRLKGWWSARGLGRAGLVEALEGRALMSAYVVTDTSDDLASPVTGSLRWAINSANADGESSSISFNLPAGTNTITLAGNYLEITDSLSMTGAGSADLVINAARNSRVFKVLAGDVAFQGLTITGGSVVDSFGAGIAVASTATSLVLTDVKITDNWATDTGSAGHVTVMGVGLYAAAATVTIKDSDFSDNRSYGGGMGIGAYFAAPVAADVQLYNTKIQRNEATISTTIGVGAGLYFETGVTGALAQSDVSENRFNYSNQDIGTVRGVGVFNNGELTVYQTRVHDNRADAPGTFAYVSGGGIYSEGTLNLSHSEVSFNQLSRGPGAGVFALGALTIVNSTIAFNWADTQGQGSGVYSGVQAGKTETPTIVNATIYGNSVGDDADAGRTGGLYSDPAQPVEVINSVIAGNTVTNSGTTSQTDVSGKIITSGNNLIFDMSRATQTGSTVITGVAPNLDGDLGFHGGTTRTLVPLENSPVIDAGDVNYSTGTDQRGFFRSTLINGGDGTTDLGAVEAYGIIAGNVFRDVNGNGIYDREDGYPSSGGGTYVMLYEVGGDGTADTGDDVFVETITRTDLYGYFAFNQLAAGTYFIKFEVPEGYYFGTQHLDTSGASQVYVDGSNKGNTPTYTVVKGSYFEQVNAGVVEPTSLQAMVYVDVDKDGSYYPGIDTLVPGAKVTLEGVEGQSPVELVTDANGLVTFTNTQVAGGGTYSLTLGSVPGYQALTATPGTLGGANVGTTVIDVIQMPGGGTGTGYMFGIVPNTVGTASVSGSVFHDVNQNGVNDTEMNLEGAEITLYDVGVDGVQDTGDDVLVDSTTSTAAGGYSFANLVASQYFIKVKSPNLYRITKQELSASGGSRVDGSGVHEGNTPVYTVGEGEALSGVNAGFVGFIAISVVVFKDTGNDPAGYPEPTLPGNGVFESSFDQALQFAEVTISGVADVDGSKVEQTQTTNEFGNVYFYLLEPGTYTITAKTPDGLQATKAVFFGTNGGSVSADNLSVSGVAAGSGQVADGYRFAFMPQGSVSGQVFNDVNQNGVNDDASSVDGTTVTLYEAGADGLSGTGDETVAGVISTDPSGAYAFTGLVAGNYYAVFDLPSGARFTRQDLSATGGSRADASGQTELITLVAAQDASDVNAGVVRFASLTLLAFSDTGVDPTQTPTPATQGDGVYLPGLDTVEAGVEVTIQGILDVDGSAYGNTMTTDGDGKVSFTSLEPGTYTITVATPFGMRSSKVVVGAPAGTPGADNASVAGVTLGAGSQASGYAFAFVPKVTVAGFLFDDANQNGVYDSESQVDGFVQLYEAGEDATQGTADDVLVDEATTDGGFYGFNNLDPGVYFLKFSAGANARFTKQVLGNSQGSVVEASGTNAGRTPTYVLGLERTEANLLAGVVRFGALKVVAFADTGVDPGASPAAVAGDAVYSPGIDPGQAGVVVTLTGQLDVDGSTINQLLTTDVTGVVNFTGLEPGNYTISVATPEGVKVTHAIVSGGTAGTPAGDGLSIEDVTRSSGESAGEYQFAYDPVAYLSGSVFFDPNFDGAFTDKIDTVLPNVTVELLKFNGSEYDLVDARETDAQGHWYFGDLIPGESYKVVQDVAGSYVVGFANTGTAGGTYSGAIADAITGIVLSAQQGGAGYSFANVAPNVVAGSVVSALQSGASTGLADVTVELSALDKTGATHTYSVQTDGSGGFSFGSIVPGVYTVTLTDVSADQVFDGIIPGLAGGSVAGSTLTVDLSTQTGVAAINNVFNYHELGGSISGTVFNDADQDGFFGEETTVYKAGVDLFSFGPDGVLSEDDVLVSHVETDDGGGYMFTDLKAGGYYLHFIAPTGYFITPENSGFPSGSQAGDIGNGVSSTAPIMVAEKTHVMDVYAGMTQETSFKVFVFEDSNGNGVFDAGSELGLPGRNVTLYNNFGSPRTTVATDEDGYVTFTNLQVAAKGDYSVFLDATLIKYISATPGNLGGTATAGNDLINNVVVSAGSQGDGYVFGVQRITKGQVSGVVFEDVNQDGVKGDSEPYMNDVTVRLHSVGQDSTSGTADDVEVTSGVFSGEYTFEGVDPGSYYVTFDLPTKTRFSPVGSGFGANVVDAFNRTPVYTVTPGTGPTDVYAGFAREYATLWVRTFSDTGSDVEGGVAPGDGVYTPGVDSDMAGVEVTLTGVTDKDGSTYTATLLSDLSGFVHFDFIPAGTYTVTAKTARGVRGSSVILGTYGGTAGPGNSIQGLQLSEGEIAQDYYFGALQDTYVMGNAFYDADFDGVYSNEGSKDQVLAGVMMVLSKFNGSTYDLMGTTQTDENGEWYFGGLFSDVYYQVTQVQTGSLLVSNVTMGSGGGVYSASDPYAMSGITVSEGSGSTNYTFANIDPNTLTGKITGVDANTEAYIPFGGMQLKLVNLDDPTQPDGVTVTSDSSGAFTFENLRPGRYTVTVVSSDPANFYFDYALATGSFGGLVSGNSILGIDMRAVMGTTGTGSEFLYSEIVPSVHGMSFDDVNGNQTYDAGIDAPLAGVHVEIFSIDIDSGYESFISGVNTGADGKWVFNQMLGSGVTYRVVQSAVAGYIGLGPVVGPAGGQISLSSPLTINGIEIGDKQKADGYAFANVKPNTVSGSLVASIGPEELVGLGNVQLSLEVMDAHGTHTVTTVTDSQGAFEFTGLLPGTYNLTLDKSQRPQGYVFDSIFVGSGGGTALGLNLTGISLAGQTGAQAAGNTYQFHLSTQTVWGRAFEDRNQNGLSDDEPGEQMHVKLYSAGADKLAGTADDVLVDETDTNASGAYAFEEPGAGDFFVSFEPGTGNRRLTKLDRSTLGGNKADATGNTDVFTLGAAQGMGEVNAGYVELVTLKVVSFVDTGENPSNYPEPIVERDGVYTPGIDLTFAGVSVTVEGVLDVDGSKFVREVTTVNSGFLLVEGLEPGSYTIKVTTPEGLRNAGTISYNGVGTVNGNGETVSNVVLKSGTGEVQYAFAYLPTTYLSGISFEDVNRNNVYDVDADKLLANMPVQIEQFIGDGIGFVVVATTKTDAQGHWYFGGVESFTQLRVSQGSAGGFIVMAGIVGAAGGEFDAKTDTDSITILELQQEQAGTGYDFANVAADSVTGYVLGQGLGSEPETLGLADVTVELTISDDLGASKRQATTDSQGRYSFTGLRPGTFTVTVLSGVPNTYVLETVTAGSQGGTVSGASVTGIDMTDNTGTEADGNTFTYQAKVVELPFMFDASRPLTYLDSLGNKVTLSLTGPGSGIATLEALDTGGSGVVAAAEISLFSVGTPGSVLDHPGNIQSISITGSTSKTTFRIDVVSTKAGIMGSTRIPVIQVQGDIASVYAPHASFTESLAISGGVGSITLGDEVTLGQAHMSFGASSAFKAGTTLTFGLVDNLSIFAPDARIAQIKAISWADNNLTPDGIKAPSIDALTITGSSKADGDFMADLILSGAGVADEDPTLNLVNIAGAITDCVWDIDGNIERINTRSGGENWILRASGLLAYLTTSKSLIDSKLEVQAIGVLSVRQHLLDTSITTGEGLLPDQFSMSSMSVGGTIINTQIDSQNTGLGTMLVTGNIMEFSVHASVLTRLNTGLSVYSSVIEAGLIGNIFVSMDMMETSIRATRELADGKASMGNMTVYAIAQEIDVISSGSVDNMRFGHLVDSYVTIGVEFGEGGMVFLQSPTGELAHLNTLYLSGTIGYTDYQAMSNSDIFAGHIGSARVYSVDESVEGHFGITVNSLDMYQRRKSDGTVLTLKDLANDGGPNVIAESAGSYRLTLVEIPDDSELVD